MHEHCAACHGSDGRGMDPLRGPFGNRRPTSRLSRSAMAAFPEEYVTNVLRSCSVLPAAAFPLRLKWRGRCALLSMCFYLESSASLITKNSSSEPSRPAPFAFSTVVVVAAGGRNPGSATGRATERQ
jgi:hypothetical protein